MARQTASLACDRWGEAVQQLDCLFSKKTEAGRLTDSELEPYKKRDFSAGWWISERFSDESCRELVVLVNGDFPYEPARIAIRPFPDPLDWPHVEPGGLLCLLPRDASIDTANPVSVVTHLLAEARQLVNASIEGRNNVDFRSEFLSYWEIHVGRRKGHPNVISLLEPQGPSRTITVWNEPSVVVLGEDAETIETWLRRRQVNPEQKGKIEPQQGALIWLQEPLIPSQFPNTGTDLLNLARQHAPDSVEMLTALAASTPSQFEAILGSTSGGVVCFANVTCLKPDKEVRRNRTIDTTSNGFRPRHIPESVRADRYLNRKVALATVCRADHLWIHGRDRDDRQTLLRMKRVACLGCGSVGGAVARLLAQAGVGNLLLVDSECLDWANTGRHALGARSVNRPKATELAVEIESSFPHLNTVGSAKIRFGPQAGELTDELTSYDLIVSTMGNWSAECYLNKWQQEGGISPLVLYGWVESHAVAAHTVLVSSDSGCFRCGVNHLGRPKLQVTDWPEDSLSVQEPLCGAVFSPYGPAELAWAHTLITTAAIDALTNGATMPLHRVWVGSRDQLIAKGGKWTNRWLQEVGDPGNGCMTANRPWPKSIDCPDCFRLGPAA